MKRFSQYFVILCQVIFISINATPTHNKRAVDVTYPYTGPAVPVGDWVDTSTNGNGKGFPRLVEEPAVKPNSTNPTNNINVISISYIPNGVNVHFQTPFGLSDLPSLKWSKNLDHLDNLVKGSTKTYNRTPPCSSRHVTQCSQFYHDIQIFGLDSNTIYYYQIQASNGTTESKVLSFKSSRIAGDKDSFTIAILNDMGYTNAHDTHKEIINSIESDNIAFAWHGGDISYADDWYSGILPCTDDWPVCYNGSSTTLPGGKPYPKEYLNTPLPKGEIPNQGGPQGGDMSVIYESNWDLWQQWMNNLTLKIPYMVLLGNHEAACAEFDGPNNELSAYLVNNKTNSTLPKSNLTYYSCPESQRNFTTFQHRFRMPGLESKGVDNFWYSFDYGLGHFISINTETDFAYSPSWPFIRDNITGHPLLKQTFITDAGPFGKIENNNWKDNEAYEQLQWLKNDLQSVNRTNTPWIIVMGHRPMYSSEVSSYQSHIRNAFEDILLKYEVDLYVSGHIHWYERLYPLKKGSIIDQSSILNNFTYQTNPGTSLTHVINGMAGNIESHSQINTTSLLNITAYLDQRNFGFSKLNFTEDTLTWKFIKGKDGKIGDEFKLKKRQRN